MEQQHFLLATEDGRFAVFCSSTLADDFFIVACSSLLVPSVFETLHDDAWWIVWRPFHCFFLARKCRKFSHSIVIFYLKGFYLIFRFSLFFWLFLAFLPQINCLKPCPVQCMAKHCSLQVQPAMVKIFHVWPSLQPQLGVVSPPASRWARHTKLGRYSCRQAKRCRLSWNGYLLLSSVCNRANNS